ncbi:MAG: uracil-DNA glycosylase [Anaerolineae bacterium]|nr:MAG: uracil-DNA glycosylase [Anaerolineae bacterium]
MTAAQELEVVAAEVTACTDCKLQMSRKLAVPGEGPADAELMFIGEGPGFHENEQGRPFVGAAGNFLEELLASIGLSREEVFITNIIKCRPPGNRDPQAAEIEACSGYLEKQTRSLNPKVIVTLGRFSMARFFPNTRISAIHGKAQRIGNRLVVPMYHPAAALHQPSLRKTIQADFARLPELIGREGRPVRAEEPPDAEQLSLF